MATNARTHSPARGLAAGIVFVAMLLAAFALWTAIPLCWVYIASKVSHTQFPSGGPYAVVAQTSGASYNDSGLSGSTTYYYVVSALNANGEGANSPQTAASLLTAAQSWRQANFGTPDNTGSAVLDFNGTGAQSITGTIDGSGADNGTVNVSNTGGAVEFHGDIGAGNSINIFSAADDAQVTTDGELHAATITLGSAAALTANDAVEGVEGEELAAAERVAGTLVAQDAVHLLERLGGSEEPGGREDRNLVADLLQSLLGKNRRAAAVDHVGEQRDVEVAADGEHLLFALGALDEQDVGTGLGISLAAPKRLVDAVLCAGVGARDDQHVRR